jgi:hypothetical protein
MSRPGRSPSWRSGSAQSGRPPRPGTTWCGSSASRCRAQNDENSREETQNVREDSSAHHATSRLRHQPRKRKLVEPAFGWMKTVGLLRKLHHRGGPLVDWIFTFHAAAYNLVRLRRLLAQPG